MSKGNMDKEPLLDFHLLPNCQQVGVKRSLDSRRGEKTGFALLDPEKRREMAQLGGITAHEEGRAHTFKKGEEARNAAYKSVEARKRKKQQREQDRANAVAVFKVWG